MSSVISAAPPSAARFLREVTAAAHTQVEALPHMPALADGTLTPARYAQVLACHWAILAPWERQHAPWLDALATQGWPYRRRTDALGHDLAALGASLPSAELGEAPQAQDPAQAWGMLYVVEGSMLGGRVIARQLRARQPALASALDYFDLGSEDPGAWRRFQGCLDAVLPDEAARAQAAIGAAAMFGHFHHHLSLGISA
ncbi:Heme oxygenase [Pseudoxanthomonas sp. GM95]|uniref:biliverdin-producing heme oxygenase n=1 Tax=Pseudoxanthomonas sp. GM95 TaxID=1881043 RepID=UPI0008C73F1F|nr:biliverdin-producing heme oxygenase [Pseudoxanthomonas sp. GM95]SEM20857.1 Heme oxygenase [Pseudoxanthomonas sp. GM95]